ncbi:MAG TPA: hypothetical protein ENI45_00995 [Thermoplasmatales archaeon]|nr:hypothetical protein [Thermoplasmatales archaeon]
MKNVYTSLIRDYLELVEGYLVRTNMEVFDRKEKKHLSLDVVAVKPDKTVILGRVSPNSLDSDEIQQLWRDSVTATHKKLILQKLHCSSKCDVKKTVYCFPPQVEDKDTNKVKVKIKETVSQRKIEVVFFDEVVQQIIDYCSEHPTPETASAASVISILEILYNSQPKPLIRLERKRRIENNYTNAQELYDAAMRLHGKENMENYLTAVYILDSVESIKQVMKWGGEFMVLKEDAEVVGIVGYKRSVAYRSLDDERIVTLDEAWEIPVLLVDKERRDEGFGWRLFSHALSRLCCKKKTSRVYVPVTGTFDSSKKGKPRDISKRVEEYCRFLNGKLVGYAPQSFGPVYMIECNYRE